MTQLPDKLSELIRVALGDLRKCEADPKYVVNMAVWHQSLDDKRCAVCLAGSVMAKSLNAFPYTEPWPADFDLGTTIKLMALNDLRTAIGGQPVSQYLTDWRPDDIPVIVPCDIPSYASGPEGFHTAFAALADALEAAGY